MSRGGRRLGQPSPTPMLAQDRNRETVLGAPREPKILRPWKRRKSVEPQRRVAHAIRLAFARANEPEIRRSRLPQAPSELSSLISALFAGILRAIPPLYLRENAIQHDEGSLSLTED